MKRFLACAAALMLIILPLSAIAGAASAAAPQNHTITAYVVDDSGTGMMNVKIEISNTTNYTTITYYGYTDINGSYTSDPLSPGNYSVTASTQGYLANATYRVDILTGNITVRFTMTQLKGNISGFVTTGRIPVINATVRLANALTSFQTLSTAPLGAYSFADVPSGTYNLSAGRAGYLSAGINVTVVSGGVDWFNLTLQPTLGILTGVVNSVSQNGRSSPLSDANVTLQGAGTVLHTKTNAQGVYYFTNLTQGTYSVSVQGGGYSPGQSSVLVTLAKTSYLNFTLPSLTRSTPFTIPGFIGNLDLDHSLVIVALIIILVAVSGTMVLLNKSYNWKEERRVKQDESEIEKRMNR